MTVTRRTTMRDVASAAGVSPTTVSYVLSGTASSIPSSTRERVMAAARELQYRPDRLARAMRTGRTGVLQLSLHMLADPWSLAVAEAVNRRALDADLVALILADGDWFQSLRRFAPDVAFIDSPRMVEGGEERVRELARGGQRIVVFDDRMEPDGFDVVRSRALPGATAMIEHLLEGTDDVACLTNAQLLADHERGKRNRFSPYADAVAAGRIRSSRVATYDGGPEQAAMAVEALLEEPPRAIFCTTDFAALAAMQRALVRGFDVPGDVRITGLGDTPAGAAASPTLTTAGPADQYDRMASIIVDAAGGAPLGRIHDFAWRVIERESSSQTGREA